MNELALGELAHFVNGDRGKNYPSGSDFVIGGVPFISAADLENGIVNISGANTISEDAYNRLSNGKTRPGDLLFSLRGTLGRVARLKNCDKACIASSLVIIRSKDAALQDYLYYALSGPVAQGAAKLLDNGSVQGNISVRDLKAITLQVPHLEGQRQIVSVLSVLDSKIELNREIIEALEETSRAIFRDWFIDFGPVRRKQGGARDAIEIMGRLVSDERRAADLAQLFPNEINDEGMPAGWMATTLEHFADLNPESLSPRSPPAVVKYVDLSNTKWGVIENIAEMYWEDAPSRARRVVRPGDTLVGTVRPGNGSYAYVDLDGLTASTGFAHLRPKVQSYQDLVFIAATRPENIARLSVLADGGAYPAVNPSVVLATPVPAVTPEIALSFATLVSPLRRSIEGRKVENRTLAETRDYLLPRLMSGQFSVTSPVATPG